MKTAIQSLEVNYLVHATEDPAKIRDAVARVIGMEVNFEPEQLEGHFGNSIGLVKIHLTGPDAQSAFRNLMEGLGRDLREELGRSPERFLDEHSSLILKLDKQRLVSGTVSQAEGDAVRVKVKPRAFLMRGAAPEFYHNLLGWT